MKTKVLKKCLAALMAATLAFPVMTNVKASETYEPGATVVQDDNSPSGYTVHFVYEPEDPNVESVSLTGTFNYVTPDHQTSATPHEYENGMYPSNMNVAGSYGYTEEMPFNEETGHYELSFPITSGTFLYSYIVNYTDGTSDTIEDPANPAPSKANPNSLTVTGDINHSLVYGKYDATKQSESDNMDYVLPAASN